jgi:multiple sugar transport system ATP-binding protein
MAFAMEMRGVPRPERERAVREVAQMLQIEHLLGRRPAQLSGGQRQRVAMGRALVRRPQVFLFDEPLSNLDAKLRVDMRTEIKRLHQSMGTTIVYVTHDQIEAMTLASRIAVMKDGEVQQLGTPAEIYNDPATVFVADFMGSPAMNLIPARIEAGPCLRLTRGEGEPLRLPVNGAAPGLAAQAGREVIFGIRPEAITDAGETARANPQVVVAPCLVEVVEPAGSDTYVVSRLGGKEVIARMRADLTLRPGETLPFAFHMHKAVFFDPASGQRVA